jgi:uncharacterized protein (TIGR02145 family)
MKKQVSTAHTLLGVVFTILFSHSSSFAQLPSYVPTDGLVGYWPFNGNAEDESGNGNDGVVNGAVLNQDRFGNDSSAYLFDGIDDFIGIPDLGSKNEFTFSSWVNYKDTSNNAVSIFGNFGGGWGAGQFHLHGGPFVELAVWGDFPYLSSFPIDLKPNTWHHVLFTFKKDVETSLFLDGKKVGSNSSRFNINFTNMRIGSEFTGRYWNGSLDDIAIWNRALTPEEIEKLFNDSKEYSCDLSDILNPDVNYGSVTDIDGNVYPTVKIGEQEWMADNLRTTRYQNGEIIPNIIGNAEWISTRQGAWSHASNNANIDCPFGKLYNGFAASYDGNLCPSGWKVPSQEDWRTLAVTLGGDTISGGKLKAKVGWYPPHVGDLNASGFSAMPGGLRYVDGQTLSFGGIGYFWSSTSYNAEPSQAVFSSMRHFDARQIIAEDSKVMGYSIRCIKEEDPCELIGSIIPVNPRVNQGESVVFDGQLIASAGTTLSWQANTAAVGWSDIHSASTAYTGLFTNKLTIKSAAPGNHLQEIRLVASNGTCFDTSNVSTVFITDTCLVTDTILTTVTDTLLIDVVLSSTSTPGSNLIRVYPNPTSSQLVIDAGQYTLMAGYTLTVTAANGAAVWTEAIAQPVYTLDLSSWGGKGLYYITLTDPQGKVVTTRKIVLQ